MEIIKYMDEKDRSEKIKKEIKEEENNATPTESIEYWKNINNKEIKTITFFIALLSIAFSLSFTEFNVFPQISFFAFSTVAIILLYSCFKKLDWIVSKKHFYWAIPIAIVSSFNAIFQLSIFSYFNIVIVTFLFIFAIYSSLRGEKSEFESINYWIKIVITLISNIIASWELSLKASKLLNLKKDSTLVKILIGVGLAFPVALIILILMLSADQVFQIITISFIENIEFDFVKAISHTTVIVISFFVFIGIIHNAKYLEIQNELFKEKEKNLDQLIIISFLSVLNVLFLVFCYIEFAFLFTGNINALPYGVTYAEYAREGFFQLLFITIINFVVLIVFMKVFKNLSKFVKIMLLFLVLFTGILIISSFYRMTLYIDIFGFTPLRMMVITFLAMESIFLLVTIYALFKPRFNLIKSYLMVGFLFFIVANISTTRFASGRLNTMLHFNSSTSYIFDVNSHFLGVDNALDLILIYNNTTDTLLQNEIELLLIQFYNNYNNEPIQNWSLIKNINIRYIRDFIK
jgi:hypothetical protein